MKKIVGFAEGLTPIALIGAGGIGKTSIALKLLHHERIKQRFGENRRFIRCDQFPATVTHFLSRVSKATGAGVENPQNLTPLLPFLSSRDTFIILDNVESILDPHATNYQEIYDSVEELCRLETISLCITSRISTIPPDCETIEVPTLPIESARDVFYRIYRSRERLDSIDEILKQLDFHPLSITLLATVAHQNRWNARRLIKEWESRRTSVLQTKRRTSLGTAIELSITSPMFKSLGPDARELLGIVAFFPQGVDENKIDWLFPTIPNGSVIFDKFCVLSIAYRSNGFITMLAPLRDYLRPKNPELSPLLRTAKSAYVTRLSSCIKPGTPRFENARWITSKDGNLEHLLDVFTSVDGNSVDVWGACTDFMRHLYWHKSRFVVLKRAIEGLPDGYHSKSACLFHLSRMFESVANHGEQRMLLIDTLKLEMEQGNDYQVAQTLQHLSGTNRALGLYGEGMLREKEALEIYSRLSDMVGQASYLLDIAWLLLGDGQLEAAVETASLAINILPGRGEEFLVCQSHRTLGDIYRSKRERTRAIYHYETALGIASPFGWHDQLFWTHCSLVLLFGGEGKFGDANDHVERAKSHAVNDPYLHGNAILLQAITWYQQRRLEEALTEASRAQEVFEKLGVPDSLGRRRDLLRAIELEVRSQSTSGAPDSSGELLEMRLFPTPADFPPLCGNPPSTVANKFLNH